MQFNIEVVKPRDVDHVAAAVLGANGKLKLLSCAEYDNFDPVDLRIFCHKYARYGLPTLELVNYLNGVINGRTAVEIGAGHGDLGYHLGIPTTDSKIQSTPAVRAYYESTKQPIINYPADVEKLEALEAVRKYRPQVVIGSWVTEWIDPAKPAIRPGSIYGIKENKLLKRVETYIVIGNLAVHGQKAILNKKHLAIESPYIRSRASNPGLDRVFIWSNK